MVKFTLYKINHFRVNTSVTLSKPQCCATATSIQFQNISITLYPLSIFSPLSPLLRLWQVPRYALSLQIYLFWEFHINGIIQLLIFCVWLFSLTIMFPRSIHVIACIIPFCCQIIRHPMDIPLFAYPLTNWWTLGLSLPSRSHPLFRLTLRSFPIGG